MEQVKVAKVDRRREVQVLKEDRIWVDKCSLKTAFREDNHSKIWVETMHKGATKLKVIFKCM